MQFNYLSTEQDRREWVEAIRVTRDILSQPALAPFSGGELSPGPSVQTDEEILDWVARDAETALHPSCTAKMGPASDPLAVVDPLTMKVHGTTGLRVADASAMPYVTNGNIYAPVMMLAEKAADLILERTPLAPEHADFYRHGHRRGSRSRTKPGPRMSGVQLAGISGRTAVDQDPAPARGLFVDGKWSGSGSGKTRIITCPADGEKVAEVAECTAADAEAAVASARRAFDGGAWPGTSEKERGQVLLRTAELLERDKALYARAEALDTGKRYVEAEYDIDDIAACFRYYGGIAGTDAGRVIDTGVPGTISRVVHAPVGVCGLITPWNYPLLQASWKVAPALLAGNTFILKPSELTPSTSILLMDTLLEAGLPAGVANLITGTGPEVGAVLSQSPDVDLVSFTGGLATGINIMKAAADTVKRVALELGGKNPNIVFADADRESALDNALTAVFLHSGQVCSAGTRLIIEESIHDEFVAELVRRAQAIRLGGPFDELAETGPLISAAHRDKVHAYVQAGIEEGATLLCGGYIPDSRRDGARQLLPSHHPGRVPHLHGRSPG